MASMADDSRSPTEYTPNAGPTRANGSGLDPGLYPGPREPSRRSRRLWPVLGFTMLGCLFLMLAGFGWAVRDTWNPSRGIALPESSAPAAAAGDWASKEEALAIAIGDSLTRGMGDDTGNGYVRGALDLLGEARAPKKVRLLANMAVSGLTATKLNEQLRTKSFASSVAQADLVLFTIGGNDLFRSAGTGGSLDQGGDLSLKRLADELPATKPRLAETFKLLREINPGARLVYVGLYNPFYDVPQARQISGTIAAWNEYAQDLAIEDGNATVVPTYDLFEAHVAGYLSSDHFHPNGVGYSRIAERVVQALS
ncbi:GDSL-type esterase/lipase family protein [Cohnella fermenti]|uniref:GDSL family lipase n=1 Tax=Cohnella fermenti TaxID=2565925 RepID=A0A4S4C0U9_9BACL|nr:GDSL-type esterase/lipase family protein [Cohnella fermenti]THF81195.1 GDSL family lipase [Cohnella fermenti]